MQSKDREKMGNNDSIAVEKNAIYCYYGNLSSVTISICNGISAVPSLSSDGLSLWQVANVERDIHFWSGWASCTSNVWNTCMYFIDLTENTSVFQVFSSLLHWLTASQKTLMGHTSSSAFSDNLRCTRRTESALAWWFVKNGKLRQGILKSRIIMVQLCRLSVLEILMLLTSHTIIHFPW